MTDRGVRLPDVLPGYPERRVYLEYPDGSRLQLMVVQGVNRLDEECDPPVEVVMLHGFGPAYMPAPATAMVLVDPPCDEVRVKVMAYTDALGIVRFQPVAALHQTSN